MADVAPSLALLSLSAIHEGANYRRTYDQAALRELAESIKAKGVLQAVLVRSRPRGLGDGYELVYGHRRVLAARMAGLSHIPATVTEMSDQEALEAQLIENAQRADVHPLDEAEGFRRLHEQHGYSAEAIGAKLGKSVSFVYGRLKLCALCDEGRTAFLEGRIDVSRALLIARIPKAELQAKAVAQITEPRSWAGDEPMSLHEAERAIRRDYMCRLDIAQFDATSCAKCLRRTGAQPELFADIGSADLCTDPSCFRSKSDEAWDARKKAAEKKSQRVLTEDEAAKVMPYGKATPASGWADIDEPCSKDPSKRTWRRLLGESAAERAVLARDANGRVHELVVASDALDDLEGAGTVPPRHEPFPDAGAASEDERDCRADDAVLEAILREGAAYGALRAESMRLAARLASRGAWSAQVIERRGWRTEADRGRSDEDIVVERTKDMPLEEIRGLALELVVAHSIMMAYGRAKEDLLAELAPMLGLKLEQVRAEARAKPEPKAQAKKSKRKAAKASKPEAPNAS